jgi:hypothetical protein
MATHNQWLNLTVAIVQVFGLQYKGEGAPAG